MANILDELDVINNIKTMYETNTSFEILKDFERVLDDLDLYVYKNWEDGEIASGPNVDRHWISVQLFWPVDQMPDPTGAKRLLDYDCKISYQRSYLVKPRKVLDPDDYITGTKKGKLDRHPIWIVNITMPKKLIADIYSTQLEYTQMQDQDIPQTSNQENLDNQTIQ